MQPRHTPPREYPHGLDPATLSDKHLGILANGFARQLHQGPPLSEKDRATYRRLIDEQVRRRAEKRGAA